MEHLKSLLILCFTALVIMTACGPKKTTTATAKSEDTVTEREDTATEDIVLHPKFDDTKICGLGPFKIGTSIDSIHALLKNQGYQFYKVSTQNDKYDLPYHINDKAVLDVQTIKPSKDIQIFINGSKPYPNFNTYVISEYKVGDINLRDATIVFYKSKLIEVSCKGYDIIQGLCTRYGNPDTLHYRAKWSNNDIIAEPYSSYVIVHIKGIDPFIDIVTQDFNKQFKASYDSLQKERVKGL